ncbi:MAG: YiiX/YebB-like N1pC/P60 family cysteine hydrolase [Flavobacteriaceae bacterium]
MYILSRSNESVNSIRVFIVLSLLYCNEEQSKKLQTGDLLFQDLNCGDLCNAIENATLGKNGERFSHIGIVSVEGNEIFVYEAYDGVSKTPIAKFLKRDLKLNENSSVVIGRLKESFQKFIPNAIKEADKRIGLPYDDAFKLNNNKYYCSEFIYDIFKNDEKLIFKIKPMTFVNQKTGKTDIVWKTYFEKQKLPIPEGELGCNPIEYYESEHVTILGLAKNLIN